ncbi:hypothetical protein Nepgr_018802 [Nepenthes gracilis]|uniref:Uncharacterized protein n=1 Tax=Nepenthes gracilis TaxID=150966 RepID=A0AAD3SU77_NEPGR|nr:hypothetical protein Nepgr_018802 [Nepenthes gracilis]
MEPIYPVGAVITLEVGSADDSQDCILRHMLLHDAHSCSQASLADLEVDLKSPISNPSNSNEFLLEESGSIERPVGDESSEGWSAEDIANDPMHYVLQSLLMDNATQLYVSSIVKVQRGLLFDFLDVCWNDVTELLNARCVVEEVHNLDRMENEGTWIQAKSRQKCKAAPKNSKSSLDSMWALWRFGRFGHADVACWRDDALARIGMAVVMLKANVVACFREGRGRSGFQPSKLDWVGQPGDWALMLLPLVSDVINPVMLGPCGSRFAAIVVFLMCGMESLSSVM